MEDPNKVVIIDEASDIPPGTFEADKAKPLNEAKARLQAALFTRRLNRIRRKFGINVQGPRTVAKSKVEAGHAVILWIVTPHGEEKIEAGVVKVRPDRVMLWWSGMRRPRVGDLAHIESFYYRVTRVSDMSLTLRPVIEGETLEPLALQEAITASEIAARNEENGRKVNERVGKIGDRLVTKQVNRMLRGQRKLNRLKGLAERREKNKIKAEDERAEANLRKRAAAAWPIS